MERGLGLSGAPNARDLGGLVAADGRRVRRGALFRASALGRLTDDDVTTLGGLGLVRVIDLRDISEITLAPPDRLPNTPPAVARLPIYDPRHPVFTYVAAVMLGHDLDGYGALAQEGTPGAMAAIYRWFVSGDAARSRFAEAVRLLADRAQLPALVHCTAGKDRTGWLTTIVLTVLGVDRADIVADYLATNDYSDSVNQAILDAMRAHRPGVDEDAIRPVLDARLEYLDAAYAEVERVYGTFDAYLSDGLSVTPDVRDALRANLLE